MRKYIVLILLVTFVICSLQSYAENIDKNTLINELKEIRTIDNDIQRLAAYDDLVDKHLKTIDNNNNNKSSEETLVVEYTGKGMRNTRPFTVKSPWEIQWDAQGDIFQIYLYQGNGNLVDVAANQQGPGEGSYYSPKAGTYYLQVNAIGSWEIQIVNVN